MSNEPDVKPVFTNLLSTIPDPDQGRIALLLEDESQGHHEFSLTAAAAYQLLSALLQKKVLPEKIKTTEHYPIPLASIAHSKEMSGQSCAQLFFPSGLPVTIEFPRGAEDVDELINALQIIREEMKQEKTTRH